MIKQITAYRYLYYLLAALAVISLGGTIAFWKNAHPLFYCWVIASVLLAAGEMCIRDRPPPVLAFS